MLLGAGIGGRGEDVLDAQRLKIRDGDRTPVHAVLRGDPGIAQSLSAFDDIAREAAVLHQVDAMGSVGGEMGAQPSTGGVEGMARIGIEDGGTRPAVTNGDLDQFVRAVRLECSCSGRLRERLPVPESPVVPRLDADNGSPQRRL